MDLLFSHLTNWLLTLGPWIVFGVALTETAFFIGLLVPAEATVLLAAFLADRGYFSAGEIFAASFAGGLIGDHIGYALGRFGGGRLLARRGPALERSSRPYEGISAAILRRHSFFGITLGRFLSFVRTLMPWFAGRSGVSLPKFFLFDSLGVLGWAGASVALGMLAGESWGAVAHGVGGVGAAVVALLAGTALVAAWRRRGLSFRRIARRFALRRPHRQAAVAGAPSALDLRPAPDPRAAPLRIGLTGNVASGKSSVAAVWRRLGARIVDADALAREAVAPGTPGLAAVAAEFGPEALMPDGTLDRGWMREAVFRDPAARLRLERILHPEVARLRGEAERRALVAPAATDTGAVEAGIVGHRPVVVHDIPLLFEVGLESDFNAVVLVDAPEEERLRRLVEDRGLDEELARRMIAAQMPTAEKRARATLVIDNAGSRSELEAKAEAAWRVLTEGM